MSGNSGEAGCEFALRTIEMLGDEKLGPGRRSRLRRHIETCPECKAYFERMTAVIDILDNMPRISAPEGFADKVLEVIMAYMPAGDLDLTDEHGHRKVWIAGAVFGVSLALGLAVVRHFVEHEGEYGIDEDD
ncbi:MAG: zf-HC2 domain-containing protein, partial [Actinobacteria bacterium]|nr:zf-HC2 domain-containing protein [Actinomycetota bacterium]